MRNRLIDVDKAKVCIDGKIFVDSYFAMPAWSDFEKRACKYLKMPAKFHYKNSFP